MLTVPFLLLEGSKRRRQGLAASGYLETRVLDMQVYAVEDDPPEAPDASTPAAPGPSLEEQDCGRAHAEPRGPTRARAIPQREIRVFVPSADQPPVRPAAGAAPTARFRDKTREEKQSVEQTATELRAYLKTLSASDDVDSLVEDWLENQDNLPPEDHKFVLLRLTPSWVQMQKTEKKFAVLQIIESITLTYADMLSDAYLILDFIRNGKYTNAAVVGGILGFFGVKLPHAWGRQVPESST